MSWWSQLGSDRSALGLQCPGGATFTLAQSWPSGFRAYVTVGTSWTPGRLVRVHVLGGAPLPDFSRATGATRLSTGDTARSALFELVLLFACTRRQQLEGPQRARKKISMPVNPRTNLRAVVSRRKSLAGAAPLPKSALAAGVATMGAMMYALLREDSSARAPRTNDASRSDEAAASSAFDAAAAAAASSSSPSSSPGVVAPFLTLDGRQVSASNVPSFMLANSGLDNEQKLQVALCRRQAWLRAVQFAPMAMLWSYAACVLTEASGLAKLPRGSRYGVPLGAAVLGASVGAYYGGLEGKPMMNAALVARPIAGVHKKRGEQEDALVAFIREGTGTGTGSAATSR